MKTAVSIVWSSTPSFKSLSLSSEGVLAYYWTQFDIPATDLEMLPEFSEERVLEVLWNGIREQGKRSGQSLHISQVTASRELVVSTTQSRPNQGV